MFALVLVVLSPTRRSRTLAAMDQRAYSIMTRPMRPLCAPSTRLLTYAPSFSISTNGSCPSAASRRPGPSRNRRSCFTIRVHCRPDRLVHHRPTSLQCPKLWLTRSRVQDNPYDNENKNSPFSGFQALFVYLAFSGPLMILLWYHLVSFSYFNKSRQLPPQIRPEPPHTGQLLIAVKRSRAVRYPSAGSSLAILPVGSHWAGCRDDCFGATALPQDGN